MGLAHPVGVGGASRTCGSWCGLQNLWELVGKAEPVEVGGASRTCRGLGG